MDNFFVGEIIASELNIWKSGGKSKLLNIPEKLFEWFQHAGCHWEIFNDEEKAIKSFTQP